MCTALLSLKQNKKFPIILTFNRDEFFGRESSPAKLYKNKKKNNVNYVQYKNCTRPAQQQQQKQQS